ncbi:hypothetical protein JCM10213_005241 [Rhodosporidiobolus nylandii]
MATSEQAGTSREGREKKDKDKGGKDGNKKRSQRPSWSCTECTRRKIRCDRVVPGCNQCIKRNKTHLCRLDQDVDIGFGPPGTSSATSPSATGGQPRYATATEYEAVVRSLGVVRQRLYHLDRVVNAFVPQPDMLDEAGQPQWAIDMNLITGVKAEQNYVSQTPLLGSSGFYAPSSVSATPAGGGMMPLPPIGNVGDEEYEPTNGFRIEGMTPQTGTLPLPTPDATQPFAFPPPPPPPLEQIQEEGRHLADDDGEVEAAVTLEFLALGRDRKQDHLSRAELRRPSSSEDEPTSPALITASLANPFGDPSSSTIFSGSIDAPSADPPSAATTQHPSPVAAASALPPSLADSLPDKQTSDAIVDFSLDRVGWQHAAVHSGQFRDECAEFFSWGEKERRATMVNQSWLALYFAVLCAGAKHMSAEDARNYGVSADDVKRLPKIYFDASIEALYRGNFLAKHSVYAVQTIVILTVACQDVGGSDLIATLLACGIRIAQHLNLHRFASDEDWEAKRRANGVDPKSEEGIKGLIQREVRKRLWYLLAAEDWYQIPYRRVYAIFPSHFTTPPPVNCHDSDLSSGELIHRPQDEPTVVSKVIIAFKVAACIRTFFEHVNCRKDGDLSYEMLLAADREIRRIIDEGPSYLKAGNEPDDGGASKLWLPWFKRYWVMSVSHKLLICHRVFLGRAFRDLKFAYSRKVAVEAARSIIQELVKGKDLPYQDVWTVPYHTVSAATTLMLEIGCSPSSDPEVAHKRNEVHLALEELSLLDSEGNSQIAARGVQLLTTLLAEEAKHRRPHGSDLRKRKAAEVDGANSDNRFGEAAKRMISSSRTPLATSTAALPPVNPFPLVSPSLATSTFPYFAPTAPTQPLSFPPGPGGVDLDSPAGSHVSDTSLTQDAFDAILQGLAGWSANPAPGELGAGAAGFGVSGNAHSPGAVNGVTGADSADFWRLLDSNLEPSTFNFGGDLLGGAGFGEVEGAQPAGQGDGEIRLW